LTATISGNTVYPNKEGVMADEQHEKRVLEELVFIRWLMIFTAVCMGFITLFFAASIWR
jgi:hypothetical protein